MITILPSYARQEAEAIEFSPDCAVISIIDPRAPLADIHGTKRILRLAFHDVDRHYHEYDDVLTTFTAAMAREIVDFVLRNLAEGVDTFACHCEAGISRSAGVTAALAKLLNNDDESYFSRRRPNVLIYTSILKAWPKC